MMLSKSLGLLNMLIIQWFFIRLTLCTEYMFDGIDVIGRIEWYSIQGFILPLTGWRGDYIFLGRAFYIPVTKKKETL